MPSLLFTLKLLLSSTTFPSQHNAPLKNDNKITQFYLKYFCINAIEHETIYKEMGSGSFPELMENTDSSSSNSC